MQKIYLDYAATTPLEPRVRLAMEPYGTEKFGNPGSLHSFGQEASAAVFAARRTIARAIGAADYREIIFTGSATEANNMVLRGIVRHAMENVKIKEQNDSVKFKNNPKESATKILHFDISTLHFIPRVIISAIEHESIIETARELESCGVEIVVAPVTRNGVIDLAALARALNRYTVLVSVVYANNEVGTIQPIKEIGKIIRRFRVNKDFFSPGSYVPYPLFHTDAVQALPYFSLDVNECGADFLTLSAHKIYGPKGVGALYIRNLKSQIANSKQIKNSKFEKQNEKNWKLEIENRKLPAVLPLVTGGGQEFGFRSGTENVAGIVGFGEAVRILQMTREKDAKRIKTLSNYFWEKIRAQKTGAALNGLSFGTKRLPNNLNIFFPGVNAQEFLIKLDRAGIAASTGSACSARSAKPSPTLQRMGLSLSRVEGSVRFTLGRRTTKREIDTVIGIIKNLFTLRI